MMYNLSGVFIALTEVLLPFMVLALDAALLNIDPSVVEAARNVGGSRTRVFFRITLPLTLPGIVSGSIRYGPSGSYSTQAASVCASPCTATQTSTAFQRPAGADATPNASSAVTNNDAALGATFYTAAGRKLSVGGGKTLTFPSGIDQVYNFCSVTNSGSIIIPSGASVTIYVDNSLNASDGCAGQTGAITRLGGGARISTASESVRKSTTTTATTVQDEAARRDKAQLCGVLHIVTIGHDLTQPVRPPNRTPAVEKITLSFTLASARRGALGRPALCGLTTDQHSTMEGSR